MILLFVSAYLLNMWSDLDHCMIQAAILIGAGAACDDKPKIGTAA